MKTVNGKNKNERLITKSKKFAGIVLKSDSNKYMRVDKKETDPNVLLTCSGKFVNTKFGDRFVVEPINGYLENGESLKFGVPAWAGFVTEHNELLFRAYNPSPPVLAELKRLNDSADDIMYLKDVDRSIRIRKGWSVNTF